MSAPRSNQKAVTRLSGDVLNFYVGFQRFVEQSSDPFLLSDARGKVLYSNRAVEALLGYSPEEFIVLNPQTLVHPDDIPAAREFFRMLIKQPGITQKHVLRLRHKQGYYPWLELHATNLLGDSEVEAIMCQGWDVTAAVELESRLAVEKKQRLEMLEKRVEKRSRDLRQINEEFERIFEHNLDALAYINDEFGLEKVNKSFLELFDVAKSNIVGRQVLELFSKERQQELSSVLQAIVENHRGQTIETICLRSDATPFEASVSIAYAPANEGLSFDLVLTIRDIREQKAQEKLLRYHASLQGSLSDAVIVTDLDFHIQSWNRAAEQIYGWRSDEALGKRVDELLATKFDSELDRIEYTAMLENQGWAEGEFQQRRKNGEYCYIWTSITLIRDEMAQPFAVVAINRDITDRKALEQTLSAKLAEELRFQEQLKELHRISLELTQIKDLDSFYRRAVELGRECFHFERMTILLYDKSSGEAVGTYGTDAHGNLIAEHKLRFDPQSFTGILARSIKAKIPVKFEEESELFANTVSLGQGWKAVSLLMNGEEHLGWLLVDNALTREPVSKPMLDILALYSLSIGTLLGQKRAEADSRNSEASFRLLLEAATHAIVISNLENKIVYLNPRAETLLGYNRENLIGQGLEVIMPELDPSLPTTALGADALNSSKQKSENFVRKADTSLFLAELEFSTIQHQEQRLTMSFIEDISPRKRAQQEMEKLLIKERELNEFKSSFIRMASHEFRTPMTIIKTSLDLVLRYGEKQGSAWARERLEKISQQIFILTSMLNDMLSLERLQSTVPEFNPEPGNLGDFIEKILAEFRSKPNLEHELRFIKPNKLPPLAFDPNLVLQLMNNLLSNAIKFSPPDKPILLKLASKKDEISISVQDMGIGIPEEDLQLVFEPFHRAINVQNIPGTGLGLAISKQIAELHGGGLRVESTVGQGTIVTITMPRRSQNQ